MMQLLYLCREDVESLGLDLVEIIELVAFALSEHACGRTEMPPKPGIHPLAGALLHAMPAYVARGRACGIKWVSAFPANPALGLPSVTGLIVLNDPATGVPEAVMDGVWITAMRTAASTAVAARRLAREDSEVMGLLGAGVQGRSNVAALKRVLPRLGLVRVYGPRRETVSRFKQEMEEKHGVLVEPVAAPEAAVRGADVLVTAAPWPDSSPPIVADWIGPGLFACALDFDASFTKGAIERFDRRACDDAATLSYYQDKGCFGGWPGFEELSSLVAGQCPGRQTRDERIVAANLGLGIYDVVVARRIVELARERGVGQLLPL